jgi:Na+/proline symporter
LFCCKDARDARKAIVASSVAVVVAFFALIVGVVLWAYYREHPMEGSALALYAEKNDRVFPIFITEVIPTGLKGVVVAGVFAAAISSLDSIMAALSQTTMSAFVLPRRRRKLAARGLPVDSPEETRRNLSTSRALVLGWAILLCAAAVGTDYAAAHYRSILDLALAMATYTGGALLAGFFLAFLPLRTDGSGFAWGASLSVMTVFALAWHEVWAQGACVAFAVVISAAWAAARVWPALRAGRVAGPWWQPLLLAACLVAILAISAFGTFSGRSLAYPWYVPIGSLVAFLTSLALDHNPGGGARTPEE